MQSNVRENKMGTMPVRKLLISMSLPMMLSMLVQALYNVVDSIFVSMIEENALTAVSLAFPIQNLMIAIASGTAVGVNALLSRSLGAKRFDEANSAAMNGLFLALLGAIVFFVFGLTGARWFFETQTDILPIIEYGEQYLSIVSTYSFGLFLGLMLDRLLQSTGRTFYAMISQICGAVTNIIFDPILIFGLCGFPKMGVTGAAIATVAGQIFGMVISCILNQKKNTDIRLTLRGFRPRPSTIKTIYIVGVPSILMMSIGSVMSYLFNRILLSFTATAATVFGIYFKLQSFVFMPVFGLNNGMVPIIAYNYGAKNRERIIQTFKLAAVYATCIMVVGVAIFQILPGPLLRLFNASDELMGIGQTALRIISTSFLFAGFCIAAGSSFQALGNGVYSLIVSIARQLIVLVPVAYLLSLSGKLELVWLAFPIAEIMSLIVSVCFLRRIYVRVIKPLGDAPA